MPEPQVVEQERSRWKLIERFKEWRRRRRSQRYQKRRDKEEETETDEARTQREEREYAAREAAQVQQEKKNAALADTVQAPQRRAEPATTLRQAKGEDDEPVKLAQYPPLPDYSGLLDTLSETQAGGALRLYEQLRTSGIPPRTEELTEIFKQINEGTPDRLRAVVDPILEQLGTLIADYRREDPEAQRRAQDEQAARHEAERKEGGSRYDERAGYLHGIFVEEEEGSREAKVSDILANRTIRDLAFDQIFALTDAQPDEQFQTAFDIFTDGIKYRMFLNDLLDAYQDPQLISNTAVEKYRGLQGTAVNRLSDIEVRKRMQQDIASDLERYKLDRKVREIVHNANFVLDVPNIKAEQIYGFIDSFSSELIDYVWRMPGVRDMMNIYEQQLRKAMWERDGYLDPEDVKRYVRQEVPVEGGRRTRVKTPAIEEESKRLFKEYIRKNNIYVRSDDMDKREYNLPANQETGQPELKDWEVDRIFTTARGMMVLEMRMLSLAAESKIPPEGSYTSLYLQDILQSYAPLTHLLTKYKVPSYKALSMLLTEPDRDKIFGVRKPWMAKQLTHVAHVLDSGPEGARKILDGRFGELLQIRRLNPALCGDAFGFLGWRVGEDPAKITGSELFLRIGEDRMGNRLAAGTGVSGLNAEEQQAYTQEYGNWIGTGLRMERLRTDINEEVAKGDLNGKNAQKAKALLERIVELQPGRIFFKSYKAQQRLNPALDDLATTLGFHVNEFGESHLQVDRAKAKPSTVMMQRISDNLLFVESQMYKMREHLLDDGFTFDGDFGQAISLDVVFDRMEQQGITLPHSDQRDLDALGGFRDLMRNDFNEYHDHQGRWESVQDEHGHSGKEFRSHEEGYYQEFIYNREYNHGFTLWSGDAPIDEFNMAATGPTGGFARRARENGDVGKGNALITQFLTELKYIRTPDEAFGHLTKIYSEIHSYDADKAKEVVTYLSEGLLKLFGATALAKIPILGGAVKNVSPGIKAVLNTLGKIPGVGKPFDWAASYMTGSAAQEIFDNKRMPVWHATETRYFIQNLLYEKGYINKTQMNMLADHLTARRWDVKIDLGQTVAPLLAIAILLHLLKESTEDQ